MGRPLSSAPFVSSADFHGAEPAGAPGFSVLDDGSVDDLPESPEGVTEVLSRDTAVEIPDE
jgi:hypothetical protein